MKGLWTRPPVDPCQSPSLCCDSVQPIFEASGSSRPSPRTQFSLAGPCSPCSPNRSQLIIGCHGKGSVWSLKVLTLNKWFCSHLVPVLLHLVQVSQSLCELRHGSIAFSSQFVAQSPDGFALFNHLIIFHVVLLNVRWCDGSCMKICDQFVSTRSSLVFILVVLDIIILFLSEYVQSLRWWRRWKW